jgi:hypothetical protein
MFGRESPTSVARQLLKTLRRTQDYLQSGSARDVERSSALSLTLAEKLDALADSADDSLADIMRQIASVAQRNAGLAESRIAGLHGAAARLREIDGARRRLTTYTDGGRRVDLGRPDPRTDRRG